MTDDVVHKPDRRLTDAKMVLVGFLDHYRSAIIRKVGDMSEEDLRTSRLPSGWTPLELLKHVMYMERRWLRWGFRAEPFPEPFGDHDDSWRWHADPDETVEELIAALDAAGEHTRAIVAEAELTDISAAGGRFSVDDPHGLPSLAWILAYVLQEYARHAGHLDIARELADGATGE
jgi:uncharacterized protein DUF664